VNLSRIKVLTPLLPDGSRTFPQAFMLFLVSPLRLSKAVDRDMVGVEWGLLRMLEVLHTLHVHEDIVDGYHEDWPVLFELRMIDVARNVRFTARRR
jgi:hypothetical protein